MRQFVGGDKERTGTLRSSQRRRKYPDCLERLGILVSGTGLVEHRRTSSSLEGLAERDQPILQAALACEATHLLTGDFKDFGPFMN